MMGGVAKRVVRLAPCPVLTVKISPADTQAIPSPAVPGVGARSTPPRRAMQVYQCLM